MISHGFARSKRFGGQPVQRYAKIFEAPTEILHVAGQLPKADAVVAWAAQAPRALVV